MSAVEQKSAPSRPVLNYPSELPISGARAELLGLLRQHRVIVVSGATGSGKTTQLPKICLEALGESGVVGLTQPRRIAARAVAARIAEETGLRVGEGIGLKLRFMDLTSRQARIKVMTDGILLNEIRSDPLLRAYGALIIDEAHERSLNIDFILGYLKRILSRRSDLTLVVTSATIDPERLATFFGGVPLCHVEGRQFPIEIRYRPPEREDEWLSAVSAAVAEITVEPTAQRGPHRDILVFLPGERWIREAAREFSRTWGRSYDILPLYARLRTERQDRVMKLGPRPRIILATNVAETSLSVPRVGFVVDTGLARVSRYAPRQRLRGLAVEKIARANAAQRAGRCGRLGPGLCLRLYTEEDFAQRAEFLDPEILRADLAGVILRLEALGLGPIEEFPLPDRPPTAAITDAFRLLELLDACDADRRLTRHGAELARLPLEPRLARLLAVAHAQHALAEGLVIASALSVPDPRESRRHDVDGEAALPVHGDSDFLSLLDLWRLFRDRRGQGWSALRSWSEASGLSLHRLLEWEDVHAQLTELTDALGWQRNPGAARYKAIHLAVLAAFIDQVAEHSEGATYRLLRGGTAVLAAGSGLRGRLPRWVVAAERLATERVYLRTVARIHPRWIVELAPHRVRRRHEAPLWDMERGKVLAREIVSWGNAILCRERRVDFSRVAPDLARRIFIEEALVQGRLGADVPFLAHNAQVRADIQEWEARMRVRDLAVGETALHDWYARKIPSNIRDRASLCRWLRQPSHGRQLLWQVDDLTTRPLPEHAARDFPSQLEIAEHRLDLRYRYDPGEPDDGATLKLPHALLHAVRAEDFDWVVPGWQAAKALALLRGLPKEVRRSLVPLPDTVADALPGLRTGPAGEDMVRAWCRVLAEQGRAELVPEQFDRTGLPTHLEFRIELLGEAGECLAVARDLRALQRRFPPAISGACGVVWEGARNNVWHWDFGDLAERVQIPVTGLALYPALLDAEGRVNLSVVPAGPQAEVSHRLGVRRLLLKQLRQQCELLERRITADPDLLLSYHGIGGQEDLVEDLCLAAADEVFTAEAPIRTEAHFKAVLAAGRSAFVPTGEQLLVLLRRIAELTRALRPKIEKLFAVYPEAAHDMKRQLEQLVHRRLLSTTPSDWREQLPRYLDAMQRRLAALPSGRSKDAERQRHVAAAAKRLAVWRDSYPVTWAWPPAVVRYRWLLEEFRVSLFAQALGTTEKVSARRLEELWRAASG